MKKKLLFLSVLITVPAILYYQTLRFGYVNWDDSHLLVDNAPFFEKPSNIIASFSKDLSLSGNDDNKMFYRPLMLVSYVVEYQWAGGNPRFYHFSNVILHIISTLLVFVFLKHLKLQEKNCFFLSLMFSVHPLTVQSVAWIQGRNDSLLSIFFLLSLISLEKLGRKFSWLSLTLHFLAFLASLLTKESALVFPVVYLAYLIFFEKEQFSSKKIAVLSSGWLLISAAWFTLRSMVINLGCRGFYSGKNIILGFLSYWGKLVFPFDLSPYPVPENVNIFYGILVLSIVALLVTFKRVKNMKMFLFGALWFFSIIGPTFLRGFTTASFIETRAYPALPGVLLMVAEIDTGKVLTRYKYVFLLFFFIVFSSVTYVYSKVFRDPFSHQIFAVRSSPNSWVTTHNLALEYLRIGRIDFAYNQIKRAYSLNPSNSTLTTNYAIIMENMGMTDSALLYYGKALYINPENLTALNNTGLIYFNRKDYSTALNYFVEGIEVDSADPQINLNLANTYFMLKDFKKAKTCYYRILERKPNDEQAIRCLRNIYWETGGTDSALYFENFLQK
ncbi:tetratricopeptide repeat protein [candidate division WOR-3 bacterium]|nr:tetratricopeptide repeat protein [candidate division WOR-3 bacterium]